MQSIGEYFRYNILCVRNFQLTKPAMLLLQVLGSKVTSPKKVDLFVRIPLTMTQFEKEFLAKLKIKRSLTCVAHA